VGDIRVRAFANDDVPVIHAIQVQCPQAAQWRQEDYLHIARDPGATILVAEIETTISPDVAGFVVFHQVGDEAELRNIAIHPSHQRKGFARALLEVGIRELQKSGTRRLFLEVRASNQPALAFYTWAGFKVQYARRDYYQNPAEDALVMACDIPATLPPHR
jgi:ribosomal-protein-alanine N-acetyltransferase